MSVRVGGVVLGEGTPKVIVPLVAASVEALLAQAALLPGSGADIAEWRVDSFAEPTPDAVTAALPALVEALAGIPLLATFRTAAEGGTAITPDDYCDLNVALIASGLVDALDVEHAFDEGAGDAILDAADAAGVPVVGSSHDFAGTPTAAEIVSRLVAMQRRGMAVAKIAVMPQTPDDVLTVLAASRVMAELHPSTPVIAISMGGLGLITRLAGQVFGSCATFAIVGEASAPGQVPASDLLPVLELIAGGLKG